MRREKIGYVSAGVFCITSTASRLRCAGNVDQECEAAKQMSFLVVIQYKKIYEFQNMLRKPY